MKEISVTNPISEFKVIKKNEVALSQALPFKLKEMLNMLDLCVLFSLKNHIDNIFYFIFI